MAEFGSTGEQGDLEMCRDVKVLCVKLRSKEAFVRKGKAASFAEVYESQGFPYVY